MIGPAPVPAGDLLDWLHQQGKHRAETVPEFDVEETLRRVRGESRPVGLAPHMLSDAGVVLQQREATLGFPAMSTVAAVAVWAASRQPPFSPSPVEPTVRTRVLGAHLRRLREGASTTTERAAAAICGSRSKIREMERGRVVVRERDIAGLLTLYGVTAGEERQALLKLAREADTPGWWQGDSDILPHWVKPYLALEEAAAFIRTYETSFVPALLRTGSYACALTRPESTSDDDVRRRAVARLYRQEILRRENALRLWAVIDESVLRRSIGGRAVMREQIRHLIDVCDHPTVILQILPFRAGALPAMGGPFTLLRFSDSDLRDVVYIEQLTSGIYLDKPAEVECYLEVMERLCLQALPHSKTSEMLRNILAET